MIRVDHREAIYTQYDSSDELIEILEDLFNRIWSAVADFFTWIIDTITDCYHAVVQCFYPLPINLREKLAPFQNMSRNEDAFLYEAFTIYERMLDEEKRSEFRENFEDMTNPSEVAHAIFRAYLFSGMRRDFRFLDGTYNQMTELQHRFRVLAESDQIAMIDKTDFEEVRNMPISDQAKEVLNELHAIANTIHQGHQNFLACFGQLHQRVFS